MARTVLARSSVLALLASAALLLAAGVIVVRARSGIAPPTARVPLAAAPAPVVPALHWPAEGLRQLLAAVEASRDEGLQPADYRRDALADAVKSARSDPATDALATESARLLAHDYADGHIHNRARFDWHIEHSPAALTTLDADLAKAVEGDALDEYLRGLLPHDTRYVALKAALHDTPPVETERIMHIRASMERWRWMPRTLGDEYVWVNVPTYTLALMHGDSVAATHVVVVGAPKTPTPMLSATIGSVIVNPWWTLPPKVLAEGRGKRYAAARGFVYVTIGGKPYVRQRPGPNNALGRMKIDMPNAYAIYLHDTPAKWAFTKSERALSHGCIRVQGISTLAGDLTGDDAVSDAMTTLTTRTLQTPKSVPVYIVYFTAAPDAAGAVVTYGDPYDRDAELVAALDHRRFQRVAPTAATKRSSLTPKRVSTTNGVSDEPERAENAGTIATY